MNWNKSLQIMRWRRSIAALLLATLLIWGPAPGAAAADSFDRLAAEIQAANSGGSGEISLSGDIVLTAPLPVITGRVMIDGGGHSISGDDAYRIFDVVGGRLTLKSVTLTQGNSGEASGGAIRMRNGGRVSIESSTLKDNLASNGGAVALAGNGNSLTVSGSNFVSNRAEKNAGAILVDGGNVRVVNSRFETNCAARIRYVSSDFGAARQNKREVDSDGCLRLSQDSNDGANGKPLQGKGGAIRLLNGGSGIVERSVFIENSASYGGAITTEYEFARLDVEGSSFISNLASQGGGAIYLVSGATTIDSSSFLKNAASDGGAVVANGSQVDIANSTFGENRASVGAGALALNFGAKGQVKHGTFFGNHSGSRGASTIKRAADATLYLSNSIITGRGDAEDCVGGFTRNIGNISADGTCAIKASGDPMLGKLTGEPAFYPLLERSPALDAAHPEDCLDTDQAGKSRPLQGGCDSGAIESNADLAPRPMPPSNCTLADRIIAANTDQPYAGCPAGNGADAIGFTRDLLLFAPLPAIKSDITIEGNGFAISGDLKFRIFDVDGGHLVINNLTMKEGWPSSGGGGAIRLKNGGRATVNYSSFIGNLADDGGALALGSTDNSNERVIINKSRFSGNQAMVNGGAIHVAGGSAEISNSSFVKNLAGRFGGAINLVSSQSVNVINSSFINNVGSGGGGALSARNGTTATLTHVTIFNNVRFFAGSAIRTYDAAASKRNLISLRNSIIAGLPHFAECEAELSQNVGNLIADGSCSPAFSGDPMLEAPAGSATFAAPLPGSPAINAADARFCPDTDQLGRARSIVGRCDIGAIEAVPVSRALTNCAVTTVHVLNFRDAPNGTKIGQVQQNRRLAAAARTPGWFQVQHEGAAGWISAD